MTIPLTSKRQRAKLHLRRLAIRLCGGLLRWSSKPHVLREEATVIIAPHQDDESLGCGGIIARKRNEGLPVHVIFITDGSASHPHHPRYDARALSAMRHDEAMAAMCSLGVERTSVHFLEEPDGTLNSIPPARRTALITRLAGLLTDIAPGEIYLPCHPDGSSEHDATFGFVIDAIRQTRMRPDIWEYPVWSWWNPGLLLRRWFSFRDCRYVELEDYHHGKQQAINCYQSQITPLAPDTKAALPPELISIFNDDAEYFFRYELTDPKA